MKIRFYIGLSLIVFWIYFCIAKVTQQHAQVQYYDKNYISEARAFTKRRRRGDVYLTNVTVVTRVAMDNNVTIKVAGEVKSIGTIVFHDMKLCDGLKLSWIKKIMEIYSNFTLCPVLAGRYQVFNLEIPPRNYNLSVPKGEGTLHIYCYLTRNMQIIFHGLMSVVSS